MEFTTETASELYKATIDYYELYLTQEYSSEKAQELVGDLFRASTDDDCLEVFSLFFGDVGRGVTKDPKFITWLHKAVSERIVQAATKGQNKRSIK